MRLIRYLWVQNWPFPTFIYLFGEVGRNWNVVTQISKICPRIGTVFLCDIYVCRTGHIQSSHREHNRKRELKHSNKCFKRTAFPYTHAEEKRNITVGWCERTINIWQRNTEECWESIKMIVFIRFNWNSLSSYRSIRLANIIGTPCKIVCCYEWFEIQWKARTKVFQLIAL